MAPNKFQLMAPIKQMAPIKLMALAMLMALAGCGDEQPAPSGEPSGGTPLDSATEQQEPLPLDRPPAEPDPDTAGIDTRSPLERAASVEATLQRSAVQRRQAIEDAGGQ